MAWRSETASGRAGGDSRSKSGSGLESVGSRGMGSPARRNTKSSVPSSSPSTSSESSSSRGAPMASGRARRRWLWGGRVLGGRGGEGVWEFFAAMLLAGGLAWCVSRVTAAAGRRRKDTGGDGGGLLGSSVFIFIYFIYR